LLCLPQKTSRCGIDSGTERFWSSDALTVVTPVIEARLQEMCAHEDLSKSTDGIF
jgi:hypothetical protein